MAKRGQKKVDLGQVINSAVSEGIEAIIESHPRFTDQGEFLASHIDRRKLSQYVGEAVEVIQGYDNPKDQSETLKKLYENTASYVASGEFFTKRGKEAVLRNSFENDSRRLLRGRGSRKILEGEKYLDKVMGSFRELYNLFKSGDYAQRMPELSSAVATVYDMGFTDAAVNILYETGMMSKRGYKTFKKAIKERTKESVEFTQEALTKYLIPQKAAASVLGVIGLGVLFSANSITGNIIGTSSSTNIGAMIFGVAVLGVSIWMFFRK